jgi:two-component system chemotaxis response regulator CheY
VDEMHEINMEFVDESVEVLNHVMNDVLELNSETDSESINNIFRAFHSMKGNSRMLGFERLGAFGHKAEDVLSLVRNKIIVVDKPIIDVLLQTLDMMILILGDIRAGAGDGRDTTKAIAALDDILTSAAQPQKTPPETPAQQMPQSEKQSAKPLADTAVAVESITAAAAPAKSTASGGIMFDLSEAPPSPPQTIPPEPLRETSAATISHKLKEGIPLKILITEDDFVSRTILMQFLSEFGNCHIAKDGLEAIQAFTQAYEPNPPQPYDLICMDMLMPNIDGAVAAKTIRGIERSKGVAGPEFETAIIFISAVSDPATIIKVCYECGANYYFVKPLDFNQMKRQMRKLQLIA